MQVIGEDEVLQLSALIREDADLYQDGGGVKPAALGIIYGAVKNM